MECTTDCADRTPAKIDLSLCRAIAELNVNALENAVNMMFDFIFCKFALVVAQTIFWRSRVQLNRLLKRILFIFFIPCRLSFYLIRLTMLSFRGSLRRTRLPLIMAKRYINLKENEYQQAFVSIKDLHFGIAQRWHERCANEQLFYWFRLVDIATFQGKHWYLFIRIGNKYK